MAAPGVYTQDFWSTLNRPGRARPVPLWTRLYRAAQVVSTRRLLAEMDERMLADIGIDRAQALTEANRKPWDTDPRTVRR